MKPEKAKKVLRQWALDVHMQYRAGSLLSGITFILVIWVLVDQSSSSLSLILFGSFFLGITLFCWQRSRGKWGVDYMEMIERWLSDPESILRYKSKRISKEQIIEIGDESMSHDSWYRLTLYFKDKTHVSIKVSKRDCRRVIPALKVLFPQLKTSQTSKYKDQNKGR